MQNTVKLLISCLFKFGQYSCTCFTDVAFQRPPNDVLGPGPVAEGGHVPGRHFGVVAPVLGSDSKFCSKMCE